MTTTQELLEAIEALSPQSRAEIAARIRSLAKRDRLLAQDPTERQRVLAELAGSIPWEDAQELIRITNESFGMVEPPTPTRAEPTR